MAARHYLPLLSAFVIAAVFYGLNKLLFFIPSLSGHYDSYHHSLEALYLFFTACMLVVLFVLFTVHRRSPDHTGYAYLGLTVIQMGLSYFMLRPILASGNENAAFEKTNFFIIFILFLATETVITIRLLNKKQ